MFLNRLCIFLNLRLFWILAVSSLVACSGKNTNIAQQKLRINLFCEPPSLDPRKCADSTSVNVLVMLFEGLTRIGYDHQPHPAVAKEIFVSEDKCTYTFKLRDSYWSNGDKVTAEDFAYAWQKILDPKFPSLFAYKLYIIKNAVQIKEGKLPPDMLGVCALDEKTLEVTLNYPTPYFLELVAFPTFYPVNKRVAEAFPEWAAEANIHYTANGPFRLKKWEHESEIEVVKNAYYWDAEAVQLHTIHLAMINDTSTEYYMYERGELDWAGSPLSNISPDFLPPLKKEGNIEIIPATAVYYYKINTDDPILANQKIRSALGLCINRKAIVEHVTQGEQRPAHALVPPMSGWEAIPLYKDGDVEKAKKFFIEGLKELGIESTQFPILTLSYNANREHQKIAQSIQHQWKEGLGIKVDLETFDWKVYLSKINKQDYQIGRSGWVGDFHDAVSFLAPFKYRDNPNIGGNNETGWEHPDYITYLNLAEKEADPEQRIALLRKAEKVLIDEMPIIPIYYISLSYLKKPYVHGAYISPLGIADFKKAYLKE